MVYLTEYHLACSVGEHLSSNISDVDKLKTRLIDE